MKKYYYDITQFSKREGESALDGYDPFLLTVCEKSFFDTNGYVDDQTPQEVVVLLNKHGFSTDEFMESCIEIDDSQLEKLKKFVSSNSSFVSDAKFSKFLDNCASDVDMG